MCGGMSDRPSRGGLMAAMFPFQGSRSSGFVLAFNNEEASHQTHATLSTPDHNTLDTLRGIRSLTMRIEKYGDLSSERDVKQSTPLYSFELSPSVNKTGTIEFRLPYKLEFGVSESGIVGRQATLLSPSEHMGEIDIIGKGVIGWN